MVATPEEELRESHQFARDSLSLPIYPELTDLEVEHIASTVTNYYKNY
jgi:dTDP-4-amino-4,6-dideoxygalactose transaminase